MPAAPWLEVDTSKATATNGKNSKQSIWIGRTDSPSRFTLNGNMKAVPVEPIAAKVITDAGRTHLEPGTVTCMGIGPATDADLERITGRLKLVD